jgi:ABC-type sugar transport system substrate-binding protein
MTAATITAPVATAPVSYQVRELMGASARGLLEAYSTPDPGQRYTTAHLAALRAAAAVLAARAQPGKRARIRSVWAVLPGVAPQLSEWATFFAASAAKRAAAEVGFLGAVSHRDADDLVRDAEHFLAQVAAVLGLDGQQLLPA